MSRTLFVCIGQHAELLAKTRPCNTSRMKPYLGGPCHSLRIRQSDGMTQLPAELHSGSHYPWQLHLRFVIEVRISKDISVSKSRRHVCG